MTPNCRIGTACLVIAMVTSVGPPALVAQDFERQKVLANWKTIGERVLPVRMEVVIEKYSRRDGNAVQLSQKETQVYTASTSGVATGFESNRFDANGAAREHFSSFSLVNAQYKASLKKGKTKGTWALAQVKALSDEEKEVKPGFRAALPWLVCANVPLPDWIDDPAFVIKGTENLEAGSRLRIQFTTDSSRKLWPNFPDHIKSGWVDLNPNRWHCVLGYEFEVVTKASRRSERGAFEYASDEDPPVLKLRTVEVFDSNDKSVLIWKEIWKYTITYRAAVPDQEFRLTFYGIPEPQGVVWDTGTRWYLWLILAAAAAIVVGAFMWRRATSDATIPGQSASTPPSGNG